MSWQATAYVAESNDGITSSEKLLLLVLANRHNADSGRCNPSLPRLAEEALTSKRNCFRLVDSLETKGRIRVISSGGRRYTNQYEIVGLVKNPDNLSPFEPINGDAAASPEPKEPTKGTVIEERGVKTLTLDSVEELS